MTKQEREVAEKYIEEMNKQGDILQLSKNGPVFTDAAYEAASLACEVEECRICAKGKQHGVYTWHWQKKDRSKY